MSETAATVITDSNAGSNPAIAGPATPLAGLPPLKAGLFTTEFWVVLAAILLTAYESFGSQIPAQYAAVGQLGAAGLYMYLRNGAKVAHTNASYALLSMALDKAHSDTRLDPAVAGPGIGLAALNDFISSVSELRGKNTIPGAPGTEMTGGTPLETQTGGGGNTAPAAPGNVLPQKPNSGHGPETAPDRTTKPEATVPAVAGSVPAAAGLAPEGKPA